MHPAKRVAVNTGFLYARMAITVFISLYATRLILNALGAQDFGLFNVVGGAIAMLTFLNSAMANATQRFMSFSQGEGDVDKQKHIFNVSVVLHFIIGILVVLLLEGAGYFLFNGILKIPADRIPVAKLIFQFMLVSTFFTIISVPYDAVINAHENMLLVAILGVIESLLKLAIAIYVTRTPFDKLISYGVLMALLSILLLILRRIYCHKKYEEVVINIKEYFNRPLFREMTGFAGLSFLSSSTSMVGNYGFGIVLNHFFGAILNAADGIAGQLNGQLLVFSNTLMKALNPAIVKAEGGGGRQNMLKYSLMGCKFSFFLFSFFAVPFMLEAPFIMHVWLKDVPEWSVLFCRLILFKTLIEQLTLPLNTAIGAQGNIKKISITKSILNLIPLPLTYILFSIGSPPYVMYIVAIIFWGFIEGFITIYFTIKNCNLKLADYLKSVFNRSIIIFLIPLLLGLIPMFIMPDSFTRLIIVLMLSMISFLGILYTIGLTVEEKSLIAGLVNSISTKFLKSHKST